ncbi:MAG: glycosyltransferase family 2 protein [Maricaulaceae bacterium]
MTQSADPSSPAPDLTPVRWTVVIPYFNERDYLPDTLATLDQQTVKPFRLVLVDNASTDGGPAVVRQAAEAMAGVSVEHRLEPRPGKIHALETGLQAVETAYVAVCDADTIYPPEYLARAEALLDAGAVAALAFGVDAPIETARAQRFLRRRAWAAQLLPWQCHTGGFGQAFRTDALVAAGGLSAERWPYVLEDHEVIARIVQHGPLGYDREHWCRTSDRRKDRGDVNWTTAEQLLYHFTPKVAQPGYFRRFLGPRLAARGMSNVNLRRRDWDAD